MSERFHREEREYTLPAGTMPKQTIEGIFGYLADIQNGWDGIEPPTLADVSAVVLDGPEYADFLDNGGIFPIRDEFYRYLSAHLDISESSCLAFRLQPDAYTSGPHREAREKNATAALKQCLRWFTDRCPRVTAGMSVYLHNLESLGHEWTVTGNATYVGTYPKRLAKYLAREHGLRLRAGQIETIGNIGGAAVARSSEYVLTFDRDYLDGTDSAYCNGGSCWWGSNSGARYMLEEHGGYAIRMWEDGRPRARCWIAPHNGYFVLFNAYGKLDLFQFARILSHQWGWSYHSCDLDNHGESGGLLYINNGKGICIGPADVIADLDEKPSVDFQWEDIDDGTPCADCGCNTDPDYSYSDPNGNTVCESCYSDNYSSCSRCGDTFQHEDVYDCDGDYYCEHCADRAGFGQCHDCDEWRTGLTETDGGHSICESCADDYSLCCDCDTLAGETCQRTDGEHVCRDCASEYTECEECSLLASETADDINNRAVCERCARSMDHCTDCGKLAASVDETANGHSVCEHCQENYRECEDCGELLPAEPALFRLCCGDSVLAT
ncbi:hypothetical protein SH661x_001824 [Planctomicrobium sp. SH661]|uniref:hypothetical protein n=1 Tax=Planctomicrobium sp. SH661 TaxID=3448124 RepID=UPI003F5C890C